VSPGAAEGSFEGFISLEDFVGVQVEHPNSAKERLLRDLSSASLLLSILELSDTNVYEP